MKAQAALIHIAIAIAIGALLAFLTPARWLAASLWVSSALMLNGAIATLEDAAPGKVEGPEGRFPAPGANALAFKVWVLALVLAGLGLAVQFC